MVAHLGPTGLTGVAQSDLRQALRREQLVSALWAVHDVLPSRIRTAKHARRASSRFTLAAGLSGAGGRASGASGVRMGVNAFSDGSYDSGQRPEAVEGVD